MKKLKSLICCTAVLCIGSVYTDEPHARTAVIVDKVEFINEGYQSDLNEHILINKIQIKPGDEFKPFLTDTSIRNLYAGGQFAYVRVDVEQVDNDKCNVKFYLTPKAKLEKLSFEGNKKIKDKRLRKEIKTKEYMPFDESAFKIDAIKLEKLYNDKAFPFAHVDGERIFDEATNKVEAKFIIDEGDKTYIRRIEFIGYADVREKDLQDAIRTKKRTFWSWLNGTGIYHSMLVDEDLNVVRDTMRNNGYLNAQVSADNVEIDHFKKGSMRIVINIQSGEKFYVGNIDIVGNTIFSEEKIRSLINIRASDVFSIANFDQCCDNIKDLYGKLGYLDAFAQIDKQFNSKTNQVNVVFNIVEGSKFTVKNITIKGNHKTKNKVILRELALAPGDQFDSVRMRNSQSRLRNTGFFETVDVSPEDSDENEAKNLKVNVTEAKTGKISIGGGISTGASVMGYLEFSQSNFDLFGQKSKFQGSGQKFRARVNAGKHNVGFNVNFEEPWFYDREIAVGTNLFLNKFDYRKDDHNYSGASYDDKRVGGEIYLRKRLFGLWVGTLAYELQNVNISDIGKHAPASIKQEKGNTSMSKGKFSLTRDTRNNFIYPRNGSMITVDTELAGGPFFGETKFFKLEGMVAKFIPTFDELDQVLMLQVRLGSIGAFKKDTVPFFERYKLGGSDYMRGFKGGDISTKELPSNEDGFIGPDISKKEKEEALKKGQGISVGGNSFGYGCAEYTFKCADPLRFHLFYEAGFVHEKKWKLGLNDLYSDAGFGFKIFIMGAPLRLDFGWPLHIPKNCEYQKHGMRFNYSFGLNF